MKYIVSSRPETIAWLQGHERFEAATVIRYLGNQIDMLKPGDIVIGSLPLSLAADICERGAQYWSIWVNKPPGTRGDIPAEELDAIASVVRYDVQRGEVIL